MVLVGKGQVRVVLAGEDQARVVKAEGEQVRRVKILENSVRGYKKRLSFYQIPRLMITIYLFLFSVHSQCKNWEQLVEYDREREVVGCGEKRKRIRRGTDSPPPLHTTPVTPLLTPLLSAPSGKASYITKICKNTLKDHYNSKLVPITTFNIWDLTPDIHLEYAKGAEFMVQTTWVGCGWLLQTIQGN